MSDKYNTKQNEKELKSYITKDEQSKNSKKETPKKIIKFKEKNNKKTKEKLENDSFNGEKNCKLKDALNIEIVKTEKILVNKKTKLRKVAEKNSGSETNENPLKKKKKKYNAILSKNFEKKEKFETYFKTFIKKKKKKKNCESDVERNNTDSKNQKISKTVLKNSEKNEISKFAEISKNKIEIKTRREKFFNYAKEGKNSEEKNDMNGYSKKFIYSEKENKNSSIRKNNKLYKIEIYEKKPNEYTEKIKKEKNNKNDIKLRLKENNMNINKIKLHGYNYNNFIENKKYNIKLNKIFIIYFYDIILKIIFFSQIIQCAQCAQIINESSYSYINLKVRGKTDIKIYSQGNGLNIIIINNVNKSAGYEIKNQIDFNDYESDINNITLIWNTTPNSTYYLFGNCKNIIEIDLSNFDSSQVTSMGFMFYECNSLTSLDLSNFNTSQVINMAYIFCGCSNLISLDLSNFNTSKVTNIELMFDRCLQLKSLNLSNFETSRVTNMHSMFSACAIISLDLSNFNTSQIKNMGCMFSSCSPLITYSSVCSYSLKSLNLSNFETSKVTNMGNMFYGRSNLISLDLSNFDTSNVTNIENMFNGCSKLNSLNLSNFDTSLITNMNSLFKGCSNLISLDLSNFNTSKVINMAYLFNGCSKLNSLNLSNFDTSGVIKMNNMFNGCSNLSSLNLSNFDTSMVNNMGYMFSNCKSLNSLDLSHFKTSKVNYMSSMFSGCSSLSSLDLSNFNTSIVTTMEKMFNDCSLLNLLNLSNFNTSMVTNMAYLLKGCSKLNSLDLSNFNTSKVTNMTYMFSDCKSLNFLDLSNFDTSKVTNMAYMFYGCSQLNSLSLSNFDASKIMKMYSMFCICNNLENINLKNAKINLNSKSFDSIYSGLPSKFTVCTENEDWAKLFDLTDKQYINCINNISSFIANDNEHILKCYKRKIYSDNPCQICGNNYFNINGIINDTYINCYENYYIELTTNQVSIDTSINNESYYIDDTDTSYQDSFDNSINNTTEILLNTNNIYNYTNTNLIGDYYFFDSSVIIEKEIEKINRTELIGNMINNLFDKLNISNIDSGKDEKTGDNNISVIITSTTNQKKNENEKMITMDLGQCETSLKNEYNISSNAPLYILQIISEEEKGMKISKIEYEIYYPFNNNNLTKLDLNLCKGIKIEISIPVKLSDNLDKHNPKSDYYNDICYTATSESGTDISLKDRKNEFVENNMTLCEENCDLIDYNYTNEKAKCSCNVKTNINTNYDYKFNKNEFFKNFINIKNIANINIIKCYKTILNIKSLIKNYGFYIMSSVIFLLIITILIFRFISYKKMKKDLYNMSILLNKASQIESQPEVDKNENSLKKINKKSKEKRKRKINNKINKDNITKIKFKKSKKMKYSNNVKETIQDKKDKSSSKQNIINISNINSYDINIKNIKEFLELKDFELNSLEFEEASKLDKRNFFQYYISLIYYNHPLFFSFGNYNDYNSRIIKIFLFFFSFASDLTINALFFNGGTMHKIYQDRGKFDLLFQIPQILYSALISRFIDTLIKTLALSQDIIIELKQEKRKNFIKKKYLKVLKAFRNKTIGFFVCAFIILSCFWYYLTCFCGIFVNTQIHLIKDCLISLLTSLIYQFAISLIPGLFRLPAIKMKKPCLYKFSSFLENYLV